MGNIKVIKFKVIFITIFFISTFTGEFFYRDPLFDNSVSIAKTLQDKLSFSIIPYKYFTLISIIDFFWLFLVFLFFPIIYYYTFFLNIIMEIHICNYVK